ncbi:TPA: hypothetical protein N0F65_012956 [Lagenidium giganteum]|uniref:Purple acid phosphatase n=1 Tax=Lagenidium giganteum TaxID=4803 RepID=A0AAV2Z704_9STRA|nr:TPA: hypothetical protein N0F65_012956 [Lagenidium giganteum]
MGMGGMPLPKTPKATLTLNETSIPHMGSVEVRFTVHDGAPNVTDLIAVYCVDDEGDPPTDAAYIDFRVVKAPELGFLVFDRIPNMRCSWQFRYFVPMDGTAYSSIGSSDFVTMQRGATEPLQVHLAPTNDPTHMRVMWISDFTPGHAVWYGKDPEHLDQFEAATYNTYHATEMCQYPAMSVTPRNFREPGMIYDAVMDDLEPGATYYYYVGNQEDRQLSDTFSFRVPLAPGTPPVPGTTTSFVVYADMGNWDTPATGMSLFDPSHRTVDAVYAAMQTEPHHQYQGLLHVGDIAYGVGRTFVWDQFGFMIEKIAASMPYMVSVGNHEYDYLAYTSHDPSGVSHHDRFAPPEANFGSDSHGECGVPISRRFHMPDNGNGVFWYSYEAGLAHHTVISAEHNFTAGSKLFEWLNNDLRSVNRTRTPWVALHLHRPMYCSQEVYEDFKFSRFIRHHLEPVLAHYRVDLVFSGHYHSYERTCAVYEGKCRSPAGAPAKAPIHIMVGAAGAALDMQYYYEREWSVETRNEFGLGRLHLHNATHAHFEFQRLVDHTVSDEAWIVSDHAWSIDQ